MLSASEYNGLFRIRSKAKINNVRIVIKGKKGNEISMETIYGIPFYSIHSLLLCSAFTGMGQFLKLFDVSYEFV